MKKDWSLDLGAHYQKGNKATFKVWAPYSKKVDVRILGQKKKIALKRDKEGFFSGQATKIKPTSRYFYCLDQKKERPDPVSRFQPEGVHGPSQIVDPTLFRWSDQRWKGKSLKDYVIYELHVGTFTKEGTFDSAIEKITYLKKLGITCVEVMPVAQCPGKRNWGYDGVSLFAVQNSYGGPEAFKRFVNACHKQSMAVCLDVVYNHLGPEGNYLHDFGPYFTNRYHTPWGDAINYDDRGSDPVRQFVISNALYWIDEYHVDALRLDAIHSIYDFSSKHILQELKEEVEVRAKKLKREVALIAESDLNDPKIIQTPAQGGYGIDSQWSDDFHHAMHVTLTGEKRGYYQDFEPVSDVARAIENRFVYHGQHSRFRQRKHGSAARSLKGEKFVICTQNHDQVGNRALGDRLSTQISFEAQKVAAVLLMMSPQVPMLWMGQEYGETRSFRYFIDHEDPALIQAVREGRKREFASFGWDHLPDPKGKKTFESSKLDWKKIKKKKHAQLLGLHQDLLLWRRKIKPLHVLKHKVDAYYDVSSQSVAFEYRASGGNRIGVLACFGQKPSLVEVPFLKKGFQVFLRTDDQKYGGVVSSKKGLKVKGPFSLGPEVAVIGKIEK